MGEEKRQNPFVIDLNDLPGEWQRQPKLSRDAGVEEAEARFQHSRAKAKLAVVEAQLRLAIRKDPEKYDLRPKPNDAEVDAAIVLQDEYQRAVSAVDNAQYNLDVTKANTVAVSHDRRKALENEVELIALNYHSEAEPRPVDAASRKVISSRQRQRAFGDGIDLDE